MDFREKRRLGNAEMTVTVFLMAEACCYGAAAKRGSPNYGAKHSRADGDFSLAVTLTFLVRHEVQSIQ